MGKEQCRICGGKIPENTKRKKYCTGECLKIAQRQQSAEWKRMYRLEAERKGEKYWQDGHEDSRYRALRKWRQQNYKIYREQNNKHVMEYRRRKKMASIQETVSIRKLIRQPEPELIKFL